VTPAVPPTVGETAHKSRHGAYQLLCNGRIVHRWTQARAFVKILIQAKERFSLEEALVRKRDEFGDPVEYMEVSIGQCLVQAAVAIKRSAPHPSERLLSSIPHVGRLRRQFHAPDGVKASPVNRGTCAGER